ncbi:uncharacterized protein LOC113229832 [Hyposmocoma kahamanoa]|uniref:uncharacterized protein LOC113229832 n=1 Tax=Hyposmocoma kahamanoa TaxID=1477025 RepID=UPI000E6DA09E|nr:uncharacterized protein LOC113229832 [Hyposmocoma kahamanoa]
MEVKQIATSNPHEYKGMFSINELSTSEKLSSIMSIGELKFRIRHRTTDKGILEFDICFLENQKWINTDKKYRDIHINLAINIDAHTRVVKILKTLEDKVEYENEGKWYAMSEFDIIKSNLVNHEDFYHFPNICSVISVINGSSILSVALEKNCMKRNPFASLHNDTLPTDFELRCENGSIPVHKVVLAIASPMLIGYLENENDWLENRWYKFSETDLSTLQHLKDYTYILGRVTRRGPRKPFVACFMLHDGGIETPVYIKTIIESNARKCTRSFRVCSGPSN